MSFLNSLLKYIGIKKKSEEIGLDLDSKNNDLTVSGITESQDWYKKQHEIFKTKDSENDLILAHYVMLLKNKVIQKTGDKFPHYWQYTYGIDNPQILVEQLYEKGFYENMKLDATKKQITIKQLTEIAEKHGLKAPKKKADLVKIILDSVDPEELKALIPYYEISDKGKKLISTDNFYGFLLKNEIEYTEYLFESEEPTNKHYVEYKEFIWQLKLNAIKNAEHSGDWQNYSTRLFNAGQFKVLDNKISEGLEYLCYSFLLDFNCCDDRFAKSVELRNMHKEHLRHDLERKIDMVLKQDNLFSLIGTSFYRDYFQLARDYYKERFNDELLQNFNNFSNPLVIIPYDKSIKLINMVLDNNELEALKIVKDMTTCL